MPIRPIPFGMSDRTLISSPGSGSKYTLRVAEIIKKEPLEDTLRHVIREEISAYDKKSKR